MKRLLLVLFASLLVSACGGSSETSSVSERGYYSGWVENFNADIAKALAKNKARDCGEFKYREAKHSKSEFLVACTRDGERWSYYVAFTASGDLTGPFDSEEALLKIVL